MKKQFWFLLLILTVPALSAQHLSLDSCKTLAMRNNVAVKNAELNVEAAKEVKKQVFTKYFPNVSAMAGGYYALQPLIEYGIGDLENAEARQWLYNMYYEYGAAMGLPNAISLCENGVVVGATAIQPVFMGGQIVNGNRLAEVGVQAAELQKALADEQLLLQVESSYWLVVSLKEKQKTLQQALVFLDTLYRDVNVARDAGLVIQNDQLKVSLKQNELRSNLLKVENGIALATMALCQMAGVEYAESIVLTDTVFVPDEITDSFPVGAVLGRKEARLLELNVDASQLQKKITIGETLPHLMVGLGASYGNPIFNHFSANGLAFAVLSVPITNWWEASHKVKQQNIIIQKAENDRDDLMQKMELETRQAWNSVCESAAQVDLMKATEHDAQVNLQSVMAGYQSGLLPVSDLLEAQTLYRQALDQLVEAKVDYRLKYVKYGLLIGRNS